MFFPHFFNHEFSQFGETLKLIYIYIWVILLMEEIWLTSWYGSLSHYLRCFLHPNRWLLGISEPPTVSCKGLESILLDEVKESWLFITQPTNRFMINWNGLGCWDMLFMLCGCLVYKIVYISLYKVDMFFVVVYEWYMQKMLKILMFASGPLCQKVHIWTVIQCTIHWITSAEPKVYLPSSLDKP